MILKELEDKVKEFADYVVQQSRSNLGEIKKVVI
jgi:hypothetical protein